MFHYKKHIFKTEAKIVPVDAEKECCGTRALKVYLQSNILFAFKLMVEVRSTYLGV